MENCSSGGTLEQYKEQGYGGKSGTGWRPVFRVALEDRKPFPLTHGAARIIIPACQLRSQHCPHYLYTTTRGVVVYTTIPSPLSQAFPAIAMTDAPSDTEEWDSLCKQCGRCCFEKLEDSRGKIIYTQTACRYLDVITRHCKIFERRFEINPHCVKLTAEMVPQLRWLPHDCGYRPAPAKFTRKSNRERKKRGG